MRIKIVILIILLVALSAILTNFYIVGNLEKDATSKLEENMVNSFEVYRIAHRANSEQRLDIVRAFSKEPTLISAMLLPSETEKEADVRHFKIFEEIQVLSQVHYPANDFFLIVDSDGHELARTHLATWKKNRFGENPLVRKALEGEDAEDIWHFDGRIVVANASPIYHHGKRLGAVVMGNRIDDELVDQESKITFGQFAYFSKDQILASTMSSKQQASLNQFVTDEAATIAGILISKNDYFEERITLGEEQYLAILSPLSTLSGEAIAGVMLLKSETDWLSEYDSARKFLLVFSLLMLLFGIGGGMIIIQKAYDSIEFILEGAHQIIMGDKDYEFDSDDDYLNQIGQTLNLMISILLGRYIPEEEGDFGESGSTYGRRILDGRRSDKAPQRLLIEEPDSEALKPPPPPIGTGDDTPPPLPQAQEQAGQEAQQPAPAEEKGLTKEQFTPIYHAFIKAKKDVGDDISQITETRLFNKLKRTERRLMDKHNCEAIDFQVKVDKKKVILKPTPIWNK